MATTALREVMRDMSLDDLTVAPDGKVQIANPEVAERISALKATAEADTHTNGSGCTSNSGCTRRVQ
jgi:hypothetical protein